MRHSSPKSLNASVWESTIRNVIWETSILRNKMIRATSYRSKAISVISSFITLKEHSTSLKSRTNNRQSFDIWLRRNYRTEENSLLQKCSSTLNRVNEKQIQKWTILAEHFRLKPWRQHNAETKSWSMTFKRVNSFWSFLTVT